MADVRSIAAIELKRQDNTFGIVTPARAYYVKAATNAESQDWIRALNNVKTQMSQQSTMAHDLDDLDINSSAGIHDVDASNATDDQHATSQAALTRAASSAAAATSPSGPAISINIPGKSHHQHQQQQHRFGADAMSPSTLTTDSETGAEHYGMSYASSTGQSYGSSPGRDAGHRSGSEQSDNGLLGSIGRSWSQRRRKGSGGGDARSASVGRGGGTNRREASSASAPESAGMASSYQSSQVGPSSAAAAAIMSSSDEEDDDDDYDGNEGADQAMPLPSLSNQEPPTSASTVQSASGAPAGTSTQRASGQPQPTQQPQNAAPSELLRDPNRVITQGYLMKQSNRRKQWRKRWFVLTASRLMYTRSHMDAKAHRQVPITSILDAIEYNTTSTAGGSGGSASGGVAGSGGSGSRKGDGQGIGSPTAGNSSMSPPLSGVFSVHAFSDGGEEHESFKATSSPPPSSHSQSAGQRRTSMVAAAAGLASNLSAGVGLGGGSGGGGGSSSHEATGAQSATPNSGNAVGSVGMGGSSSSGGGGGGGVGGMANSGGNNNISGGGTNHSLNRKRMDNCFKIITPKRVFLLCAPTEEEEIKWLSALQALLARTRGQGGSSGTVEASMADTVSSPPAAHAGPTSQAASSSGTAAAAAATTTVRSVPSEGV